MSAGGDFRRWPVEPGVPGYRAGLRPLLLPLPVRREVDSCSRQCVTHVEEVIQMEGPQNIAAMIVEGITGTNGLLVPPDDYFPKLRALLDKYGILMIDDEVMAGFGRTGKWLATQHYGIKPDIVTCAKGLTSGYQPLGAVIVSDEIARYLETNMLWTGLTFSGHPMSCAAAVATLAAYEDEGIFENVERQGAHLAERLEAMRAEIRLRGRREIQGPVQHAGARARQEDQGASGSLCRHVARDVGLQLISSRASTSTPTCDSTSASSRRRSSSAGRSSTTAWTSWRRVSRCWTSKSRKRERTMIVGCPKEIKNSENRVGITPAGVRALAQAGHKCLVERSAGSVSGFSDDEYAACGATLVERT